MQGTIAKLSVFAGLLWTVPGTLNGQSMVMSLPRASQRAVVSQRLGLTDITITYHRPLAGNRKIWGGIVPYGSVWRAGANENTVIEVSDAVTIEGKPLPKGAYGLHMIPGQDSWTVIFSKNSTSWGSFTYKEAEDALRVTVKPQPDQMKDALAYDFEDLKPDSVTVVMRWEKVAVPFQIAVSGSEVTLQNIRNQLRNLAQYTWIGWDDAANYCLATKTALEEGLKWAERSIQMEERFENLITKSGLLDALNRGTDSAAARKRAFEVGNAMQVYFYGRQLQSEKKSTQALEVFQIVARRFPEHWLGHVAKARIYSSTGDFANATKEIQAAQAIGVPEQQKTNVENLLKRLANKEDING